MKTRVLIYTLSKAHLSMDSRPPMPPTDLFAIMRPFLYLFIIPSIKAALRSFFSYFYLFSFSWRGKREEKGVGGIFFLLSFSNVS